MNKTEPSYEVHPLLLNGEFLADPASVAWATLTGLKQDKFADSDQQALCLIYFLQAFNDLRQLKDDVSKSEVARIYKSATQITGLGPIIDSLFSPSNLPGTLAAGAAAISAAVRPNLKVKDLLDMDPARLKELIKWAEHGTKGIKSANIKFKDITISKDANGRSYFNISAKKAKLYKIKNVKVDNDIIKLPIGKGRTFSALTTSAKLSAEGLSEVSFVGKFMGIGAGGALSMGPQAILDALDAKDPYDFINLEAHSQTGNILSWVIGIGVGTVMTAAGFAALPVILVGLGVGVIVQIACGVPLIGDKSINDRVGDWIVGGLKNFILAPAAHR